MDFKLSDHRRKIFILGAGASVDYGLPTWKELVELIKDKLKNDKVYQYKYKKEMLEWLNKTGENEKYKTIDECIKHESVSRVYHDSGDKIENELFKVISEIFEESYKDSEDKWIRLLNDKIKNDQSMRLVESVAFINYNYDNVLDKNFLNFDYLSSKDRLVNYADILHYLSDKKARCLHPHGFFSELESGHIFKEAHTNKTNKPDYIDVVSCYESKTHRVIVEGSVSPIALYILGLGAGLEVNLNNIEFKNRVSEIHITVRQKERVDAVKKFLAGRFGIEPVKIMIYEDCKDLISKSIPS